MSDHTMTHWPSELYLTSPVIARDNRENWVKAGAKDTYARACDEVDRRLAAYRQVETDPAVDAEMRRIIRSGLVDQAELPLLPPAPSTGPPASASMSRTCPSTLRRPPAA